LLAKKSNKVKEYPLFKGAERSMKDGSEQKDNMNLREEVRTKGRENESVEFSLGDNLITYRFKLRDFSSKGFGLLIRQDSKVLKHVKSGDIINMQYHPYELTDEPVRHRTKIKHISEPDPGKHQGHMLVGLLILE